MAELVGVALGAVVAGWIWVRIGAFAAGRDRNRKPGLVLAVALGMVAFLAFLASTMGIGEIGLIGGLQVAAVLVWWWAFKVGAERAIEAEEQAFQAAEAADAADAAEQPDEEERPSRKAPLTCPSCAQKNKPGAKFCKACGAGLRGWRCRSCTAKNARDAAFCDSCGAKRPAK